MQLRLVPQPEEGTGGVLSHSAVPRADQSSPSSMQNSWLGGLYLSQRHGHAIMQENAHVELEGLALALARSVRSLACICSRGEGMRLK